MVTVETGCRGHHNGATLVAEVCKTPLAESLGIINRQAYNSVESTFRLGAVNALDLVKAFDEEVAASLVLVKALFCISLGTLDRSLGNQLTYKRRAKTALSKLHNG